jgi:hypothetical protein
MMGRVRLGLVTNASAGWKTVRERWERDLADCEPSVHHIEDHSRALSALSQRYGAKSVGMALAGRSAAHAALNAGARVALLSTLPGRRISISIASSGRIRPNSSRLPRRAI